MSTTPRVALVPVEEPYDDYERQLIERIQEVKREYETVVKPYIDALVRSRSMKMTRTYLKVDLLAGEQRRRRAEQ